MAKVKDLRAKVLQIQDSWELQISAIHNQCSANEKFLEDAKVDIGQKTDIVDVGQRFLRFVKIKDSRPMFARVKDLRSALVQVKDFQRLQKSPVNY